MDSIIRLDSVDKRYPVGGGELPVLKGVNLHVQQGEFLAILGASGSGKSTLMNIIGCMDTLSAGQYLLDGQDVSACDDNALAELRSQKIGFVFQKYQLIPQYTVLQNVLLPLFVRGLPRTQALGMAEEQIERVGLTERIAHKPCELSGGQQQRVAIARALVGRPALLLADEPTGALDSAIGREILDLFAILHRQGNTVVMITHDKSVAGRTGRVATLVDGVLQHSTGHNRGEDLG